MTSKAVVDEFISKKNIAIVGVSRSKTKFGNAVYKELKQKGYNTFPVNPNMELYEGDKCYKSLLEIDQDVDAVVTVVHPSQTENVVKEAKERGINYVWMQQGSESENAVKFCKENGINEVHKECILMFAEPVKSFHSFHRWVWKVIGKLPN